MTRTLLVVGAAVAALGFAGTASAQQQAVIGGSVAPVCSLTNLAPSLNFASLTAAQQVTDQFSVQCNNVDGSVVRLNSAEGHLESDDFEDQGIGYIATMIQAPIGLNLTLVATSGTNDIFNTDAVPASFTVAGGVANAAFTATLQNTAVWAGGYHDTLTASITPN